MKNSEKYKDLIATLFCDWMDCTDCPRHMFKGQCDNCVFVSEEEAKKWLDEEAEECLL